MNDALKALVRPNILNMKAYASARSEFGGNAQVYLDANENPFDHPYNRYPDPMQMLLRKALSEAYSVSGENIFISNGSDEAIDLITRIFTEPGKDEVIVFEPGFSMYAVAAQLNNVSCLKLPLDTHFDIDVRAYRKAVKPHTKITWITTPNNPTGNLLSKDRILEILNINHGIVVIDEAYMDYADDEGFISKIYEYDRLIVLRTFSKAMGAAGIRLGIAFSGADVIALLNKIKMPYNVNDFTQNEALKTLQSPTWKKEIIKIRQQRAWLEEKLSKVSIVQKIHPSQANFLLDCFEDADQVYNHLLDHSIVVRNRSNIPGCKNCLRITIGKEDENQRLIHCLESYPSL